MKATDWKWVILLAILSTPTAYAQTAAFSHPSVSGNPVDSLPQVNTPQKAPSVTVHVEPQTPQLQELLARHITPSKVQIEGVKAVPFAEVANHFSALVGHDVTIADLIKSADEVTALYKARGYALSFCFVPAQTFQDNVVRVTVVEGYVAEVKIKGNAGPEEAKIRAIAEHIRTDRPLRQATFERYINVLGLLPGTTITANVAAPQNTNGATDLELDVKRKPFNLSTGIDFNHPGVQGIFTATENGMIGFGESLSVSALLPKGRNDQTYFAADGAVPLGSDGWSAKVDASHYRGHPVDNPGLPSTIQRTVVNDKLGFTLSDPIQLNNSRVLTGSFGAYASHDQNFLLDTVTPGNPYIDQRSQVRVTTLQLDFADIQPSVVRRASINVAKAFDVLGASKEILTNIAGGSTDNPISLNFVRTGASYSQSNQWPLKIGTVIAMTGQYSPDSLPTSEQISFGAQRFALGYEPGEASGDSGWGASFEVNRAFETGLTYLHTLTPYVSIDAARVYLHTGTPSPSRLASVGIGFRLSDGKYYSLDLSVARALGDAPVESPSRSPRVNATFSYQLD